MDIYQYYLSLDEEGREAFAERAKTKLRYLTSHIMKPRPKPIKGASLGYMERLSKATNGEVELSGVVSHFADRSLYSGSKVTQRP